MPPTTPRLQLESPRTLLRAPGAEDYEAWRDLRFASAGFLTPWEPAWEFDHLSPERFAERLAWSERAVEAGEALPLFIFSKSDGALLGAITLDSVRLGALCDGHLGFWIGTPFARQGYMSEAVQAVLHHAFEALDLSRIQAACLPENVASRAVLERAGFVEEGLARAYMQVAGKWRDHVVYARLRRGRKQRPTRR